MAAITAGVVAAGAAAYSANRQAAAAKAGSRQQGTQELPKWQQDQIKSGFALTNAAANRTADQAVAGFSPDQQAAFGQVRANNGMGYGDLDQAVTNARGLTGAVGYSDVDLAKYQNPFQQQVIDASMNDLQLMRSRSNAQIASDAEAAGAFGGDRAVVAQSLNNESLDRTASSNLANLRMQGFNTSAGLAQNDASMRNQFALGNRGLQLSGNAQLQQMIEARRGASQTDANNMLAIGNQQQGQDQAMRDWEIQRAQMVSQAGSNGAYGGTYSSTQTGPSVDRVGATMQGLSSGLQFGRDIYNSFKQPQVQNQAGGGDGLDQMMQLYGYGGK